MAINPAPRTAAVAWAVDIASMSEVGFGLNPNNFKNFQSEKSRKIQMTKAIKVDKPAMNIVLVAEILSRHYAFVPFI